MKELNIRTIQYNPSLEGMAEIIPDVTYSTATGKELKLSLIVPWRDRENETEIPKYPLIVFVQGSAWTFPNIYYEIPQLSEYARNGYIVATVTHRNCIEGNPFPAYLQDVKTAIRFLRKNADEYGIDTKRVGIWGTSSGGNTALLVGLTQDESKYETQEHLGVTDAVKCVVDCFGPTDMNILMGSEELITEEGFMDIFKGLTGGAKPEDCQKILKEMSPVNQIRKGVKYPPFLLIHGNADPIVPYEQSVKMYQALLEAEVQAEMICVENAPHEGTFWSRQVHEIIMEYFNKNL